MQNWRVPHVLLLLSCLAGCRANPAASPWEALFDGETLEGWRAYQGDAVPESAWRVVDGSMVSQSGRGEIVTEARYEDFELHFEWKVTEGANSGVFYRVEEGPDQVHFSGLEYQVLDNVGQSGRPLTEQAAACYGVIPAAVDATRAVGEWNTASILVLHDHVTHRLNGQVVADFEFGSDDWNARVTEGPMKSLDGLGKTKEGLISLQNYHGHEVAFRGLRIRRLLD